MLKPLFELLAARGWFDTAQPFEQTIGLTQGACLWMLLTRHGSSQLYVKFSEHVSLQGEAARYEAAWRCYPGLVPRFVGHARQGALEVLACQAVETTGLSADQLCGPSASAVTVVDLLSYFSAMRLAPAPASAQDVTNLKLESTLAAYFEGGPLAGLARRWLRSDAMRRAARLAPAPQHGDLVLNNLARTRGRRLVIFDWEDFGSVSLPGLDLFTLELSLAGSPRALFAHRHDPAAALTVLVGRACAALGLEPSDYYSLTPAYALVFRYLKRNYGSGVRERMDRLLGEIDGQRLQAEV